MYPPWQKGICLSVEKSETVETAFEGAQSAPANFLDTEVFLKVKSVKISAIPACADALVDKSWKADFGRQVWLENL